MRTRINRNRLAVWTSLAFAALTGSLLSGCASHGPPKGSPGPVNRESLSLNLAANPNTKSGESNAPFIGHVQKDKQDFYFVLKGRSVIENGVSVAKPYTASLTASVARVYIPGMIGAFLRGDLGTAKTTTVDAYATSTAFAIVTDADLTTYVIHLDHQPGESVIVSLVLNPNKRQTITANGFVVVKPNDLKIEAFTPITDNDTLPELPPDIAKEVNALRAIAKAAGVP